MKHRWMPVFWGDFLANTLHLSAQEVGAYFLLIAHAWEHGGFIPCHQAQRIARVDNRNWRRVREKLEPFFEIEEATRARPRGYVSRRVLLELAHADELSSKRKAAAQQMLSKRSANAQVLLQQTIQQKGQQNGGILPSKKERPSFPLLRTRATGVDNSKTEPEEPPQEAGDKKASDVSRAELEAIYAAAKQPKEGT